MKSETISKPEHIDDDIWQANQKWIQLTTAQSSVHRQQRDPRLYRSSSQQTLITPVNTPPKA